MAGGNGDESESEVGGLDHPDVRVHKVPGEVHVAQGEDEQVQLQCAEREAHGRA